MIDDRDIERTARRLGHQAAAGIDVDRTSRAVLARLRATPARRWWEGNGLLRLAAALALVVSGTVAVYRSALQAPESRVAWSAPVSLTDLSDADLAEVLDSLSGDSPAMALASPELADLSEPELDQLLDQMEG